MIDQELLTAISELIDRKLEPVNDHLSIIDIKLDRNNQNIKDLGLKVEELEISMKLSDRSLQKQINKLQDGQETLIAVLEAKGILPKAEGQ